MEIRSYNQRDREAVIRLMIELQDYERELEPKHFPGIDVTEKYWDSLLKNKEQAIFVAEEGGSLVGLCVCVIRHETDLLTPFFNDYAWITEVIVSERYRKQKIGAKLVEAAEKYARDKGIKYIGAAALYTNSASQALFNAKGFRKYEVEMLKEI